MALTPRQRKAALTERDIEVKQIAAGLGVEPPYVSMVLWGRRRVPRIEQAIADALELPVEVVFDPVVPEPGAGSPPTEEPDDAAS